MLVSETGTLEDSGLQYHDTYLKHDLCTKKVSKEINDCVKDGKQMLHTSKNDPTHWNNIMQIN